MYCRPFTTATTAPPIRADGERCSSSASLSTQDPPSQFLSVFLCFSVFLSGGGERFGSHDRVLTLPGPAGSQEYILLLLFFFLAEEENHHDQPCLKRPQIRSSSLRKKHSGSLYVCEGIVSLSPSACQKNIKKKLLNLKAAWVITRAFYQPPTSKFFFILGEDAVFSLPWRFCSHYIRTLTGGNFDGRKLSTDGFNQPLTLPPTCSGRRLNVCAREGG